MRMALGSTRTEPRAEPATRGGSVNTSCPPAPSLCPVHSETLEEAFAVPWCPRFHICEPAHCDRQPQRRGQCQGPETPAHCPGHLPLRPGRGESLALNERASGLTRALVGQAAAWPQKRAEYGSECQGRKARAGRPVRQLLGTSFAHSAGMLSPVPASGTPTQAQQWAAGAGRTGSLGSLQAGAPLPCPGFAVCRWQAALLGTRGDLWQEGLRGSPEDTEGPQVSMSRQLQPSPAPVKDSSMLPSPPLRLDGP